MKSLTQFIQESLGKLKESAEENDSTNKPEVLDEAMERFMSRKSKEPEEDD